MWKPASAHSASGRSHMSIIQLASMFPQLNLMKVMNLAHLKDKLITELTLSDLTSVRDAVIPGASIPISDELKDAALHMLRGDDIHKVADMIQSPESISQLMTLFTHGVSGLQKLADAERIGSAVSEPVLIESPFWTHSF